jgi:ABC-type Fe3+ transport system permease subunit
MSSTSKNTRTATATATAAAVEAKAQEAAMDAAGLCVGLCNLCCIAVFLLGGVAVFGVGIWLVTSFDSSTDNFKGGIAAIVLGGSIVFALVCGLLALGCASCAGCITYYSEKNKQKSVQNNSENKNSSVENKPADIV